MTTYHRTAAVGAGLVCAALGLAALIGCSSDPLIAPTTQVSGAYQPLDYWISLMAGDARRWQTLKSDCVIVVRNPQIPRPGNQVAFANGKLWVVKPGKVRLEATKPRNEMLLRIVGDGRVFRADMPIFRDTYGGTYVDTRPIQTARVPILAADLANAFDPLALLAGRGQLITQWERFTVIDSIRPVSVPTDFLIEYPDARTVIRVMLTDPKLNVEIAPELFELGG